MALEGGSGHNDRRLFMVSGSWLAPGVGGGVSSGLAQVRALIALWAPTGSS